MQREQARQHLRQHSEATAQVPLRALNKLRMPGNHKSLSCSAIISTCFEPLCSQGGRYECQMRLQQSYVDLLRMTDNATCSCVRLPECNRLDLCCVNPGVGAMQHVHGCPAGSDLSAIDSGPRKAFGISRWRRRDQEAPFLREH